MAIVYLAPLGENRKYSAPTVWMNRRGEREKPRLWTSLLMKRAANGTRCGVKDSVPNPGINFNVLHGSE